MVCGDGAIHAKIEPPAVRLDLISAAIFHRGVCFYTLLLEGACVETNGMMVSKLRSWRHAASAQDVSNRYRDGTTRPSVSSGTSPTVSRYGREISGRARPARDTIPTGSRSNLNDNFLFCKRGVLCGVSASSIVEARRVENLRQPALGLHTRERTSVTARRRDHEVDFDRRVQFVSGSVAPEYALAAALRLRRAWRWALPHHQHATLSPAATFLTASTTNTMQREAEPRHLYF